MLAVLRIASAPVTGGTNGYNRLYAAGVAETVSEPGAEVWPRLNNLGELLLLLLVLEGRSSTSRRPRSSTGLTAPPASSCHPRTTGVGAGCRRDQTDRSPGP